MARSFPFTIRQVAKILGLIVRYENQHNGNMDIDCPFCKKESKLNLNAANNIYRCNYCDDKGGMVQLYGKVLGISNSEAYREICEVLGCNNAKPTDNVSGNSNGGDNDTDYSSSVLAKNVSSKAITRAGSNTTHQAYSMLISMLNLANPHKEYLLGRGLSPGLIDKAGYKSVPAFGQQGLCAKLLQSGCVLEGVPGFYRSNGEWNVKLKAPGIIIPICGIDGKISGLQIRLNKPINSRKYIWLSSPDLDGGASSGSPIHFIGDPAAKRIYVTDGALKGNVAHGLTGYTFACLPGVKSLNGLDGLISSLKANGAKEILEAFDIHKLTDNQLGASAAKLREKIASYGLKVTSAIWGDNSLKGIDDYFLSRAKTQKNHVYNVNIQAAIAV